MRKYYTRACNFYYGNYAKNLIKNRKALALTGNLNIAFDQIEVFERKGRGKVKNYVYPISEIKKLPRKIKSVIQFDLKNITSKRKNICKINFNSPRIMGVLNITPDSFSDGGLFFNEDNSEELRKKKTSGKINFHPPDPKIKTPIKKPPTAPLKSRDWYL